MTNKTPEQKALEWAELQVPYRPWVDQYTYAEDAKLRKIIELTYLKAYEEARKAEWILKKHHHKMSIK